ncbi:MAG: hypothetical protein VX938_11455, partial [Myxococcota bacterium]|nr:hypothetical protein [Myxococcota bacterium]
IGTVLSVPPDEDQGLPETCEGHHECPLGYECLEGDLDFTCEEQFGIYEISDVPTNTPLVIRARATTFENKWHDTYTFNVFLYSDTVVDGRVHYDATMVSHGQWLLTANTVALADIPPEHGAIGGRVRDCRIAGERASWPVSDVTLALAAPSVRTVFFNNLEDDTVPLVERTSTNILGRFAALDIEAGWNQLAGSGRVGDEVVSMGAVDVYVIPNALSVVTFPGREPFWKQE